MHVLCVQKETKKEMRTNLPAGTQLPINHVDIALVDAFDDVENLVDHRVVEKVASQHDSGNSVVLHRSLWSTENNGN